MAAPSGASRAPMLLQLLGLVLLCAVLFWVTSLQLLEPVNSASGGSGPASSDSSSARLPSGLPDSVGRVPVPGPVSVSGPVSHLAAEAREYERQTGLPDSVGRVPVPGPVSVSGPVSHLAAEAREYERQTGRLDRVYCMVPTVWTKNRQGLMRAIIRTWGGRCDYVKFMIDRDETGVVPRFIEAEGRRAEIVHIPMVRKPDSICQDGQTCRHIWEKVWRSWVYVFENDLDKAEWFLKIDDDTFYVPTNMRKYVRDQRWLPDDKHYFGHLVYVEVEPFELISGICTAFSRGSIRALAPRLLEMKHEYGARDNFPNSHGMCVDRDGATEERVTSKCLAEVGIRAEAALEDGRSEAVLPLGLPFTATYKRKPNTTSWYWFRKPKTRGDAWDCCSKTYTWGMHGHKGDGGSVLQFHEWMFKWSSAQLMQLRDKYPVMSDQWAHPQFVLQLRASIAADPHAYPAATIPA
jgi:hypothetical protein